MLAAQEPLALPTVVSLRLEKALRVPCVEHERLFLRVFLSQVVETEALTLKALT